MLRLNKHATFPQGVPFKCSIIPEGSIQGQTCDKVWFGNE